MQSLNEFKSLFDETGRYRTGAGSAPVVFATRGDQRFPGVLHFADGLCFRMEMKAAGEWSLPKGPPVDGVRFLLWLDGDAPYDVAIKEGRVFVYGTMRGHAAKLEFLSNVKLAGSLMRHERDSTHEEPQSVELRPENVWLTPKAVAGFDVEDFRELEPEQRANLKAAVQDFLTVASDVPQHQPATTEHRQRARAVLERILSTTSRYVANTDEMKQIETVLSNVKFPSWVRSWNYELDSDATESPVVRLTLFVDGDVIVRTNASRTLFNLENEIELAFGELGINRACYIQRRSVQEYKAIAV